jgi:alkaline phosphatase D
MPKIARPCTTFTRRSFVKRSLATSAAGLVLPGMAWAQAPGAIQGGRPGVPYGVRSGDLARGRAIVWSKTDRPARMLVRWSTTEGMTDSRDAAPLLVTEASDFTGKIDLRGLPPGQTITYEVSFLDLGDYDSRSEPVRGRFKTPPATRQDVRFVWSGDMVGQGWGINPDLGGIRIYRAMEEVEPDFFLHCGDSIYADGPLAAEVPLEDGTVWKNIVTEEKSKVAETLAEFRGAHAYNMLDEHVRAFQAAVPMFAQWDDHEVINNWYWEKRLPEGGKYQERSVAVLAAHGLTAFLEYNPVRPSPADPLRIYRRFAWGPSLDIFRIDMRAYRGRNSSGMETGLTREARILGTEQTRWLKQALLASEATWKVIQADMPLGLKIWDKWNDRQDVEAVANGDDGVPAGRELEMAEILRFIRDAGIKNVVWLTADVHYTAAHYYDPNRAAFQEFAPFWEFVSGPLNAGTFGPNELDSTFGPEAVFVKAPAAGKANLPPSAGMQFFGQVDIDGETEVMSVRLKDLEGATLFTKELTPEA